MKWLAIKRADGERDEYAIAFATHTVCKTLHEGKASFNAWRLAKDGQVGTLLGAADTAAGAKLIVENDAREKR